MKCSSSLFSASLKFLTFLAAGNVLNVLGIFFHISLSWIHKLIHIEKEREREKEKYKQRGVKKSREKRIVGKREGREGRLEGKNRARRERED